MNLKDCKFAPLPLIPARALLDASFEFAPAALPAGAVAHALIYDSADSAILAYTVASQGLPQEDIDKLVRLAIRKGLRLTDAEALSYLTEHAIHQYGVGRLSNLTPEQYEEMVKHFRFLEVVPSASSLGEPAAGACRGEAGRRGRS